MTVTPPWAELLQLVPVVSLAFPIVRSGTVDLTALGTPFGVATGLAILIQVAVLAAGHRLNPILVGTSVWLALGAVGFGLGVAPLASLLGAVQGFGLVLCIVLALVLALPTGGGAIGAGGAPEWVRSRSLGLIALAGMALLWAWVFRDNVRLGGGLPFILLNLSRRAAIGLAQRKAQETTGA